jgi:hypothetical protein
MSAECSNACRALGYDGAISYGITRQYVKTRGWGVWQAFREVAQNALDELQYVMNDWPVVYPCYNTPTESIVYDWGRGLAIRHLLVGTSEKPEWSRGRFGEGLKLALMVLANQGVPVYIRSGDREIKPTFVTTNIEGASVELFCVCYRKAPGEAINGTEVHIGDPTLCSAYKNYFVQGLPGKCTAYTTMRKEGIMPVWWEYILDCDEARGKIYVRDIYVRDVPALFGYNLFDVKLSESRDIASEYDIRQGVEQLWEYLIMDLYKERKQPGTYEPQLIKRWTELLTKLIDGALKASMAQGKELETEIYPVTWNYVKLVVTDLFTKMYGENAVVVTTPDMLEYAKYVGMNPIYFCTTPFCRWLSSASSTTERINEKVGKATATVPKDKLPAPLKCIIDDLEGIANLITANYPEGNKLITTGQIKYGYLQEGVCGQTETKPSTRIILSIPCLIYYCSRDATLPLDVNAARCVEHYLSTLLHELAHAVSDAPDGSTDFERELTKLLGMVTTTTFIYYNAIKSRIDNIIAKIGQPCE